MALKIRLRQQGRNNHRVYRLVVTDTRRPRDGEYIETIGLYDPAAHQEELILSVKPDRVAHWLELGAQPTEKVVCLIQRAAPEVMKQHKAKEAAHRLKMTAKRRDNRRAKAQKK